jgi:hypothetical protein
MLGKPGERSLDDPVLWHTRKVPAGEGVSELRGVRVQYGPVRKCSARFGVSPRPGANRQARRPGGRHAQDKFHKRDT